MHRWIKTVALAAALASLGILALTGCSGGSNTRTTSKPTYDPATIARAASARRRSRRAVEPAQHADRGEDRLHRR